MKADNDDDAVAEGSSCGLRRGAKLLEFAAAIFCPVQRLAVDCEHDDVDAGALRSGPGFYLGAKLTELASAAF